MATITVKATSEIPASPELVYSILADYHNGHPYILPKPAFTRLVVERGGIGAGTVIYVEGKVGGVTRSMRMEVTEPDPGHILVETDHATGMFTTFTVESLDDGARSHVEIRTSWEGKGVKGFVERLFVPPMMKKIFQEELHNLAHVAAAREENIVPA